MEIPYEIISGEPDQAYEAIQNAVDYMKKHKPPFALGAFLSNFTWNCYAKEKHENLLS